MTKFPHTKLTSFFFYTNYLKTFEFLKKRMVAYGNKEGDFAKVRFIRDSRIGTIRIRGENYRVEVSLINPAEYYYLPPRFGVSLLQNARGFCEDKSEELGESFEEFDVLYSILDGQNIGVRCLPRPTSSQRKH